MAKKQIRAKNHTGRIGDDFFKEFESINNERLKINLKRISIRTFTNLLLRHDAWNQIKKDTIKIKFGDDENE